MLATQADSGGRRRGGEHLWYVAAMFYLLPFADAATGYMVLSGASAEGAAGSISQLLRGALLLPALLLVRGRGLLLVVAVMAWLLALELAVLLLHQQPPWFVVGLVYDYKLVYLIVVYFALREIAARRSVLDLSAHFIHGATLYGIMLVLSTLAGLHTPTYEEGTFGSKGVFASGNALSLYLGCASLIALDTGRPRRGALANGEAIFLILCSLIVGTKASLIFGLLFIVVMLRDTPLAWRSLFLLGGGVAALAYAVELAALFALVFDVIIFRFEASDSFFAFLASGRDVYVADALASFDASGWTVLRVLFGTGSFISFRGLHDGSTEYDTLETDLFDIFFSYGLIGLLTYFAVIGYGLIAGLRARRLALLLAWSGVCTYSIVAGHVAFNAMSGTALPILLIVLQHALHEPRTRA